jgi:hypothetical protein
VGRGQVEAPNLLRYACTCVGQTDIGDSLEPSPGFAPPQEL